MTTKNRVDLRELFLHMQASLIADLTKTRAVIPHAGEKGEATEYHWMEMLSAHLPKRYRARRGRVIDCTGALSEQIDVIIHDAQYSPLLFEAETTCYVPAESVYAVLEVKQELTKETIEYAGHKAATVRALKRTSAPIIHAGGRYDPSKPKEIVAGILTLESGWSPPFGDAFRGALGGLTTPEELLHIGCALKNGAFQVVHDEEAEEEGAGPKVVHSEPGTALISFFLGILALLQRMGTVPALDLAEYAKALDDG